jgi:hypothetical protein
MPRMKTAASWAALVPGSTHGFIVAGATGRV